MFVPTWALWVLLSCKPVTGWYKSILKIMKLLESQYSVGALEFEFKQYLPSLEAI